ncbi:hypothetical protein SAY86_022365 [Trapa natans]|uniref:BHLH domain-containing protein n=1 Tax=Trapa natans TaxID=22666 RepID=A0AAN7R8C0_TRANT|nr:hypothetical protein SAY86_022365 [Trapa natans]
MAAPPSSHLQSMLQAAVQSVKWTYSLYWRLCPHQGILIWGDGYYNGPIKTRKTVQPMEVSDEEASLQRSQQLRELYDSLSAGETNHPARRPCASLSPEDLTETEWFYLMCASFSFPPGVGLPGKAYSTRQHVWLIGANEVDSMTFPRAILAKSAQIQTVVCIPLLDGVVELGSTERVQEDVGYMAHVKSFFVDYQPPHLPAPKPALSGHSTSNPGTSSNHPRFHAPPAPGAVMYLAAAVGSHPHPLQEADDEEEEEELKEEEDDAGGSDSEDGTGRAASCRQTVVQAPPRGAVATAEPSELMHLEMSEDIQLGSPEDGSNNLDSDFYMLTVNRAGNVDPLEYQRRLDAFRAESSRRWQMMQPPLSATPEGLPPLSAGPTQLDQLPQEDTHYSYTVSTILQSQKPNRWHELSSTSHVSSVSPQSAFSKWTGAGADTHLVRTEGTSQFILKCILFSIPFLHNKSRDENSPKSGDGEVGARFGKGDLLHDEPSANHVLAERRRREKLNERFIILRSMVPFVTKMDKASILGDTIEYVKQLRKKIQDLETKMEANQRPSSGTVSTATDRLARKVLPATDKRKMRIVDGGSGAVAMTVAKQKAMETPHQQMVTSIQVSIIESDGLIELQCPHKEGLLLDVMQMLRGLMIEITVVQSSLARGFFVAELRAKVKENQSGRKASIVEVKRAIQQLIHHGNT